MSTPSDGSFDLNESLNKAGEGARRRTPLMFGVVALCFLLPFVSVTCSGQRILTMKGLDFVLGSNVEVDDEFEQAFDFSDLETEFNTEDPAAEEDVLEDPPPAAEQLEDGDTDPNVWAIIAFVGAISGLVLSLVFRLRRRMLASAITAGIVLAALIVLRFDLSGDTSGSGGIVAIEYRFGYWIAVVLAAILALAHGIELRRTRASAPPGAAEVQGPLPMYMDDLSVGAAAPSW